ncbi:LOB domain-containing protein 37-like [Carex rostrata]
MSCNGCRVLRKGCSDSCVLRASVEWIESPKAQAHATVFVAKFFGRAGLIASLSGVPQAQRPALFQSLLYEACGRTISPVSGAIGLMWGGQWDLCEAAVDTVLCGGSLRPVDDLCGDIDMRDLYGPIVAGRPSSPTSSSSSGRSVKRRRVSEVEGVGNFDLDLCLMAGSPEKSSSDESVMTNDDRVFDPTAEEKPTFLLNLFK